MRLRTLLCLLVLSSSPLFAQSRGRSRPGTGNPSESEVPWHFVENSTLPNASTALVLFWIPASAEEMERSPLRTSHALLEASQRCVALEIVLPSDHAAAKKLGATPPAAILTDEKHQVLKKLDQESPAAVEHMVEDELSARDNAMFRDLAAARQAAAAGDKQKAIDLYRHIWDTRCLYPIAGEEAQRGLKSLGVIVKEPVTGITPPPKM